MSERAQDPKRRPKALSDVAAHAGVSTVTVSRALHRPELVSIDLRQRIESAVHKLGYIPNQLASALASAHTNRIGVIVPSLTNGLFGDYLRALHDVFLPAHFQVLVQDSGYAPREEERAIATMLGQRPEAMIVTGTNQTQQARKMLGEAAIPVIQTMEITDDPIDIVIGFSQRDAGYSATRHLIELGHIRVGQMSVPLDARARQRLDGYRRAMAEANLEPFHLSLEGSSSFAYGALLFAEMIGRWPSMTALFAGNDNLALGALFECKRRGIRVPKDLSIVGFHDLEFSVVAFPSLTTVATPSYAIGKRSAKIVLEIIRGSGSRGRDRRIDLGFKLIERESTRPALQGA